MILHDVSQSVAWLLHENLILVTGFSCNIQATYHLLSVLLQLVQIEVRSIRFESVHVGLKIAH